MIWILIFLLNFYLSEWLGLKVNPGQKLVRQPMMEVWTGQIKTKEHLFLIELIKEALGVVGWIRTQGKSERCDNLSKRILNNLINFLHQTVVLD